ncbi:MAG: family 43 glycosylhydrolase [Bacteroidota bacterium]
MHKSTRLQSFFYSCLFLVFTATDLSAQSERPVKAMEKQYCADLGNGTFLNPILRGNYADPSVLRDGEDYYMTHSSFSNIPGLLVWHSKDLVNWQPIGNALFEHVGSVWAPDLVKYKDTYYIYFPSQGTNWVVTAKNPAGPWSKPTNLHVGEIDPGHIATPDGKRYLHLSGGHVVSLSEDGLKVTSPLTKVYEGWKFPKDWIVECFCLESPKLTYRNGYYYLTVAQGGTAGPPTSHMVVSARSKSPTGPWENSPYNPVVRNTDRTNKWVSIGHGTLVDSPDGKGWIVFHGFERANRTIGRQTLLLPIAWTADGWYKVPEGADLAKPMQKPKGTALAHGMKLSDDFQGNTLSQHWNIPEGKNQERFVVAKGELTMKALGKSPADTQPLTLMPANNSYELTVELTAKAGAKGGLLVYYNTGHYGGLEFDNQTVYRVSGGGSRGESVKINADKVWLRLVNDHHDLLYYYSRDGKQWERIDFVSELSGYQSNALEGWGYLRPGIYSTGTGEVSFRNFQYQGLDER